MENKLEKATSRRVLVREIVSSRYQSGKRPLRWDQRRGGIEKVVTDKGEVLTLLSGGGQSTPKPGWELLLVRAADEKDFNSQMVDPIPEEALTWTLYGIQPSGAAATETPNQ